MAPVEPRAQEPRAEAPRVVAGVPMPPERPFDLGRTAGRNAGPVRVSQSRAADRPAVAGLFFAPASGTAPSFRKDDPFAALSAQRFVSLRADR
jgi:rare lipoprotein A